MPRTTNKRNTNPGPQSDNYGRLQPQDVSLEKAIIGALLLEKDAYAQISEILAPEVFYDKRHQTIFEAIQKLNLEEKPVDLLTVSEQLSAVNKLAESGGPAYLAELSQNIISTAHLEYHARIVRQKFNARSLISYAATLMDDAFDPTQDVDEVMQRAEGALFQLSQKNMKKDYTPIDPVITQAIDMIHTAAKRVDGLSGISSGFHKLDKMTSGWQNSDLVILAARPAMGKTAFALSMAKNIAVDQGIPVAFFSLEMANVQLVNRLISNTCEIESEKIRNGQLENFEWSQLDHRINDLRGKPIYVDDTPSLSVFELRTKARRLVREHGVKLIMIDYLQLMNASGLSFGSRQEEVSTISRSLKGLAKELNIPILALSQLNRGVENRVNEGNAPASSKRPQLSDLRESGAIEQDADMVLFIHRPEYYGIKEDDHGRSLKGMAEIIIAKHRNGAVGDVRLRFKGKYARFENEEDDNMGGVGQNGGEDIIIASSVDADFPAGDMNNLPPISDDPFPPMGADMGGFDNAVPY